MAEGLLNQPGIDQGTQDKLDAFVANGVKIIHDDKVSGSMIAGIVNSADPVKSIADATLNVVERLEQSAAENQMQLGPEILVHGANALMGEIITACELSGMPKMSDDDKYMAFSLAVSKYLDSGVKSGKISQEQLTQMAQEAAQTPEGKQIVEQGQSIQQGGAQPPVGR